MKFETTATVNGIVKSGAYGFLYEVTQTNKNKNGEPYEEKQKMFSKLNLEIGNQYRMLVFSSSKKDETYKNDNGYSPYLINFNISHAEEIF